MARQRAARELRRHPGHGRRRHRPITPGLARDIANIAVGKGGLAALGNGVAQATLAVCDPGTVSNPPGPGTPASASCGINYSDGSVWKQTVTVTFNGHGSPVTAWADLGTEILQPTAGQL